MKVNLKIHKKFTLAFVIFPCFPINGCLFVPNFHTSWISPEICGTILDSLTNQPEADV